MRRVIGRKGKALAAALVLGSAALAAFIYWSRPRPVDLSDYAPADCLAFLQVSDLSRLAGGLGETTAWRSLAEPVGAPASLGANRWWLRLASWTGIGSADTVILARSQVAMILSGAEGTEAGSTLTIKPLATFVIETHTSQRRMR